MNIIVAVVVAASLFMLLREIYRRVFMDFGDDETVHTMVMFPLWNRPDLSRVDQVFLIDTDNVRKSGKRVIRYVNLFRPWERVIAFSDPFILRETFVGTQWEKLDRSHPFLAPHEGYAGGLIFMANGPEWRETRAMFERLFSNPAIRSYVPILNAKRDIFMGVIEKARAANPDGTIEIQSFFMKLTFDVISRLAFGEDFEAQTSEKGKKIMKDWEDWFQAGVVLLVLNLLLGEGSWTWAGKALGLMPAWLRGKETVYGLIDQGLQRRKKGIDLDRVSIMDEVMRNAKMPEFLKDEDEFKKHLATILFAGHDTTAGTLTCAIHLLGKNPRWQDKIRKEVMEAVPSGEIKALEPLENLPALNAVIKETMRLYPSATSGGNRYMRTDFTYEFTDEKNRPQKVHFKKGDWVFPLLWAAQRDPDFWSGTDPEIFDPQRWLDDPNFGGAKHPFSMGPFGNGPRKCVGEKLALGEMRLILASILSKYEVVPGKYDFVPKQDATIAAKYGVHVRLVPVKA